MTPSYASALRSGPRNTVLACCTSTLTPQRSAAFCPILTLIVVPTVVRVAKDPGQLTWPGAVVQRRELELVVDPDLQAVLVAHGLQHRQEPLRLLVGQLHHLQRPVVLHRHHETGERAGAGGL